MVIELHKGEKSSTKVWRFLSGRDYIMKGLRLNVFYHDDLTGRVHIESDGDMQAALQCFIDKWDNERRKEYLILHAEDCHQCKQRVPVVIQLVHQNSMNSLQRIER